jgi:hypothetical protein
VKSTGFLIIIVLILLVCTTCIFETNDDENEHYLTGTIRDSEGNPITEAGIYVVFDDTWSTKGINDSIPVEIFPLYAVETVQHFIQIHWVTYTESNMTGFYLYRNTTYDFSTSHKITSLIPATNTNQQYEYSFLDTDVTVGTFYYWLECVDTNTTCYYYGPVYCTVTLQPGIPDTWNSNVFPNPFQSDCKISYEVPEDCHVKITVRSTFNDMSITLLNSDAIPGRYFVNWHALDSLPSQVCNGVYMANVLCSNNSNKTLYNKNIYLLYNPTHLLNSPVTYSSNTGYSIPIQKFIQKGRHIPYTDVLGQPIDNDIVLDGNVTLYIKKDGYETVSRHISISDIHSDRTEDFVLQPEIR